MSFLIPNLLLITIVAGQLIKLPLGLGGATSLDLVVLILVAFFLIKSRLRKSKLKIPYIPIWVKAGLFFSVIALVSLIFSPLSLGVNEKINGFLYIVRFTSFIFLGWLIQPVIPLSAGIHNLILKSGVILAVLGLLQFIFIPDLAFLAPSGWDPHYFRTVSTFLDPNFLGAYLVLTLLLFTSLRDQKKAKQSFAMTTVYLALLTTFSRGAYLAFLVAFLTLSFLKKSLKLGLLTITLFSVLMLGFQTYHQSVAAPRGINRAQSADARLDTWQQGLTLFITHPILGVGFNAYRPALREYGLADKSFLERHGASTNDSSLLFVAATTGAIGLLAYIFFLGSLAHIGLKKNHILLAGLAGLLSQSFFANTLFYPPLLLAIILLVLPPVKYQEK